MADRLPSQSPRVDVPALRKAMAVLETLARSDGLTMTEIQQRAGIGKTMTFRVLRVLVEHGYVEHDPTSRRYSLGLRFLRFGAVAADRLRIVPLSQPIIARLREEFRETVNVAIMADGQMVYVAIAESRQDLRMATRLGSRGPIHATAIGKAVLAFLPTDQRDALIDALPLDPLTPSTIASPIALRREMGEIRARGYAVDNEENEIGARCVGVPILGDGPWRAGLSVSGPRSRIDDDRVQVIADRLWDASRELSQRLGYTPDDDDAGGRSGGPAGTGVPVPR